MNRTNSTEKIKFFTAHELCDIFESLDYKVDASVTDFQYGKALRDRAFIKIMYYCALRVSEVSMLQVEDFNQYRNELYCKRLKNGVSNTLCIVDRDVLDALKTHLKVNRPHKYIFENISDGTPISRKTADALVRTVCKKLNIDSEKIHCHTFRHTMAIRLLDEGCSIYDVQYWLGHRNIENTQIYTAFTSTQRKRLYNTLTSKKNRSDYTKLMN